MNDRELLEFAAKAAGLNVTNYDWQMGCRVVENGVYKDWNPLTDDGDAFRLSVKLKFQTDIRTLVVCVEQLGETTFPAQEQTGDDPYAATRRAIVRAAAEIGKAMNVE